VGDQDRGDAALGQDIPNLAPQTLSQLDIQTGERLIEQHQVWLRSQGPGQRDALLLSTRELVHVAIAEAAKSDDVEQLVHALAALSRRSPAQAEGDVALHGQVRKQGVFLKDHPDATVLGRHRVANA
jgi:hypothetical protein